MIAASITRILAILQSMNVRVDNIRFIKLFAWSLTVFVSTISVINWGNAISWDIDSLSMLTIFPLLGLIAFSIMWSHYIVSAMRQYLKINKTVLKNYIEITGFIVLFLIILHPALLSIGLFRSGLGLPPGSYTNGYIMPGASWATFLGTLSLLIFLAYELRRKFSNKSWWKYISFATDAGMVAVIVHALKLGQNLQAGFLKYVWYFYAITFLVTIIYLYNLRLKQKTE